MSLIPVSDQNFDQEVLQSDQPVIVDFWAEWCGPCRQFLPIVESFANAQQGKVKVVKVNIDENPETPSKFGVRSIPTLMLFKGGQLVDTKIGAMPENKIEEWVKGAVA